MTESKQPAYRCLWCKRFFERFACNWPDECDCPKCQGYCECREPESGQGEQP